jgi:hypothetical protein
VSPEDHPGEEEVLGFAFSEAAASAEVSDGLRVRRWKADQLARLGLPRSAARLFADLVDWHELEALLRRGCPLGIALEIAR